MPNQYGIQRTTLIKIAIFCVSGLIVIPLLLRDCVQSLPIMRPMLARPPEAHLVGTYVPDMKTVKYISNVQDRLGIRTGMNVLIRIRYGGFEMRDIPYLKSSEGPRILVSFERHTSWHTFKEGNTWRMYFDSEYKEGIRADVLGDAPPYRIRLMVGDPSINEPLTFVKAEL